MNRYHNGKIYKLVNTVDNRIYIGSTATELSKRLHQHKITARKEIERKVYRELNTIGWEHVRIIQIEAFRCQTKQELIAREQYHMDLLKPELNKNAAINKYMTSGTLCIHDRMRYCCIECGGVSTCIHNKQRKQCKVCSPAVCELCDITTSKGSFNQHLKSDKHKNMVLLSAVIESN